MGIVLAASTAEVVPLEAGMAFFVLEDGLPSSDPGDDGAGPKRLELDAMGEAASAADDWTEPNNGKALVLDGCEAGAVAATEFGADPSKGPALLLLERAAPTGFA